MEVMIFRWQYRLNYKIASVGWTTIFNQASGFKVSWHLPDGTNTKQKRSIYDLHDDIKFLYQSHGLNGQSCLARNICEAMRYAKREDGVMAKILKLLARYEPRIILGMHTRIN
ncbi:hypothetical protein KQX54_009728 [Cotesia glomerata]|uniref:Uncharacterized protein n=1 Tax=Cotesia glomerata TaxID=32391 RepID=A0AAV7IGG4_COTGL|nr:hypothetical protein KQX54_009728 [Cotesia glomerata]